MDVEEGGPLGSTIRRASRKKERENDELEGIVGVD